jgi:plasmid stabilization system protein ParE
MTLRWSPDAVADLEMIVEFIAKDIADAARRVAESIYEQAGLLARFPNLGREG